MATTTAPAAGHPLGRLAREAYSAGAWLATVHVAGTFAVGTVAFGVLSILVVLSVPLLTVALAGLPVLWLAVTLARLVVRLERGRLHVDLGVDLVLRPGPAGGGGPLARARARLGSAGSWAELGYAWLAMPIVGWACGAAVLGAWGTAAAFISFPAYGFLASRAGTFAGWHLGYGGAVALHVSVGLALLVVAPWLARGAARLQVTLARRMLSPGAQEELTRRVRTLEDTRSRVVDAADAERRRIERDLHDGAQQRLVAVALALGRARARFDDDPDAGRVLVGEAHEQAKQALAELRELVRGIHPAVLTDRGLDAALSALAARCPVPVGIDVAIEPRAGLGAEAVAYFVVAEALTNVAKHAGARRASVLARRDGDRLVVEVSDDGAGGARIVAGSGLAGLRDRVEAVDGTVTLSSPPGGPTRLRVELACGS
jgi:signal transduction histidine kinase